VLQFFWNFSTPGAVAYFRDVVMVGGATASPALDGVFSDDIDGFPAEHAAAAALMGITAQEGAKLQAATAVAWQSMFEGLVEADKFNWQAFIGGAYDETAKPPNASGNATCGAPMRTWCEAQGSDLPLLLAHDGTNTTAAAFLVGRDDHWWFGTGWMGHDKFPTWYPQYDWRVGPPAGKCVESKPMVFTRAYTNAGPGSVAAATLDCNSFEASFEFHG
jgi:hypothetical protein